VRAKVQAILDEIEAGGDAAAMKYAAQFDRYDGNVVLTRDEIDAAAAQVPQKLKDDIRFAWDNVRRFAEADGLDAIPAWEPWAQQVCEQLFLRSDSPLREEGESLLGRELHRDYLAILRVVAERRSCTHRTGVDMGETRTRA